MPKLPAATTQVTEDRYYVQMLEPQSDGEIGRKLGAGEIIPVPESKARRLVENVGVAKLTTKAQYEKFVQARRDAAERRANQAPVFGAHVANANVLNANFAALSRDPNAFDTSQLPRRDPDALAAATERGIRRRQGEPVTGESFEQQLAALDASEVAKGNIPVSAGLKGDEFLPQGQSQVGTVGAPGVTSAPLSDSFEDLTDDLEGDEAEDLVDEKPKNSRKGK